MMKHLIQQLLRFLSRAILKKYQPEIIGITGSVGKTTTKEAVYHVLAGHRRVRRNAKNYNNEIGVPLTIIGECSGNRNIFSWIKIVFKSIHLLLFRDASYPEILILEMGADRPGDIQYLTKLAPCDIGILTAIGTEPPVHIEFFKDLEQLVHEKGNVLRHLKKKGLAIYNHDDDRVVSVLSKVKAKMIGVGFSDGSDFRASDLTLSSGNGENNGENGSQNRSQKIAGLSFKLHTDGKTIPVFLPNVLGKPPVMAVLCALAVGSSYDISLVDLLERIKNFATPAGRMRLIPGIKQTTLFDDSYNASPESVLSALEVLQGVKSSGRKIVCLGDMAELGGFSKSSHQKIGHRVAELGCDFFVAIGPQMTHAIRAAQKAGMPDPLIAHFDQSGEAGRFLQQMLQSGDIVLIKGSQSQRTERVVKELMAEPERAKQLLVRQDPSWANKVPVL